MSTIENSKKVTRGNVEKLQKEFMQAWALMDRDRVFSGGETDPQLFEKAEQARRLYVEAMYDCDFDDLDETIQSYNPYEDLKDVTEFEAKVDEKSLYVKYAEKGQMNNTYKVESRNDKLGLGELNPNEEQYKVHEPNSVNETPIYLSRGEIDDCINEALSVADGKIDDRGRVIGNRFQDLAKNYMLDDSEAEPIDMEKQIDIMINGKTGPEGMDDDAISKLNAVFNTNEPRVTQSQDNRRNRNDNNRNNGSRNQQKVENREDGRMDKLFDKFMEANDPTQIKPIRIGESNMRPEYKFDEVITTNSKKKYIVSDIVNPEKKEQVDYVDKIIKNSMYGQTANAEYTSEKTQEILSSKVNGEKVEEVIVEETVVELVEQPMTAPAVETQIVSEELFEEYEIRVPIQDIDEETDIDQVVMFETGITVGREEVLRCVNTENGAINGVEYKRVVLQSQFVDLNRDTDDFVYVMESGSYVVKSSLTDSTHDSEELEDMISHVKEDSGVIEEFAAMNLPRQSELEASLDNAIKAATSDGSYDESSDVTIQNAMNEFGYDDEYDKNEKFNNRGNKNNWR